MSLSASRCTVVKLSYVLVPPDAVMESQAVSAGGAAGRVHIAQESGFAMLDLQRVVPLSELRRHKRAFMKLTTQQSGLQLSDAQSATRMFAEYLAVHVT